MSKCFIAVSVGMVRASRYHRLNMKTYIINGSEASRLSVAIQLQSLMGHKSVSSTEVYTKVFALDVAARHRVQFQMSESDAVAMLKGNG